MNTQKGISIEHKNVIAPRIENAIAGYSSYGLDVSNPDYITFQSENIAIELIGGIHDVMLSSLRVSIKVYKVGAVSPLEIYRTSLVDLFNDNQVSYTITKVSERLKIESLRFKQIFYDYIERVDNYRRNKDAVSIPVIAIASDIKQQAQSILKQDNPISYIETLLSDAGISDTRVAMQLYIGSLSRITDTPIHSIINSPRLIANGLIQEFISVLPKEHLHEVTTISKHALSYPPTEEFWNHKTLVLHQLDSIKEKGNVLLEYLIEGQSKRLVTQSDEQTGNYTSHKKDITTTINLMSYTDSDYHPVFKAKHTLVIPIKHTNVLQEKRYEKEIKQLAGLIDTHAQEQASKVLQQIIRELDPIMIYNPIVEQVDLSHFFGNDIKSLGLYLRLVNLITLLHQHSSMITLTHSGQVMDVKATYMIIALERYREVWLKKDDELYFNVRSTFNALKEVVKKEHPNDYLSCTFKLKEIRKALGKSPVTLQRHLNTLELYGKIERCGGNNRVGYEYKIREWVDTVSRVEAYNTLLEELKIL